jgi:dynein heavy chain, axonemal
MLRYYYYIHNGIDTSHVAPLEEIRLKNIKQLLSERLRKNFSQFVIELSDEVKDDYLLSVKKAIVDFVLKDSTDEFKKPKSKLPEYRLELEIVPKPWHHKFEKSKNDIAKNLHSTNPCMTQVLKIWDTTFRFEKLYILIY